MKFCPPRREPAGARAVAWYPLYVQPAGESDVTKFANEQATLSAAAGALACRRWREGEGGGDSGRKSGGREGMLVVI